MAVRIVLAHGFPGFVEIDLGQIAILYFKGVKEVMAEVWGHNERYMFTRDVTLKALIRVLDDLMVDRKLMGEYRASMWIASTYIITIIFTLVCIGLLAWYSFH